jgi:hypothetical protein
MWKRCVSIVNIINQLNKIVMKKMILAVLIFLGVTAKGQEVPSRIQEVFDATNIETTFYKEGWYIYDVSESEEEAYTLQMNLLETCESWYQAPALWEGVLLAREFDYDDWVVIFAIIQNDNGVFETVGDIMQKGVAVNN